MTTITIDRALLEQALDAIQELEHASTAVADKKARDAKSNIRAALSAPATAPDELERLRQIAHLTGTIFCYGNFVAETHNEAVLEKLLRENGTFWDSVEQYEKSQGWRP
jgi:hypothetical protein